MTRDRRVRAVLVLAALAAAAPYVLAISPYWNISPDSATYVGGGLSLAAGEGYAIRGRPIHLHPPLTSLLYAATLWCAPGSGLLGLRIVTVAVVFLGLAAFFHLARREVGASASLAVVVLSLGSSTLLQESTRLLSEMLYLLCSVAALLLATAAFERRDDWRAAVPLGAALLATVMTRTIGVVLPIAVLVFHGMGVARRREQLRPRLALVAVAALAAGALWDLRSGRGEGISYAQLLMQREMWVAESGAVSPLAVAARLVGHLPELAHVGGLLTNDALPTGPRVASAWLAIATVIFLAGLFGALARPSLVALYLVAYLVVSLSWSEVVRRFFVPLIPFLFLYAGLGLAAFARVRSARRLRAPGAVVLAAWALVYFVVGFRDGRAEIAEQHWSPFGTYPIKYRWNYDGERVALWLREHGGRGAVYASSFPDVYDFITDGRSVPVPQTRDPERFVAELDSARVAWLLLSLKEAHTAAFALPAIERYPDRFELRRAEPEARLYAYRPE